MILTILLALTTKTEATLVIITMLLGAGIIGFVTSWLIINARVGNSKKAQEDNKDLRLQLLYAHAEILQLKKRSAEKREKMLGRQGARANAESQLLISRRKKKLDFESFGTATKEERDDLKMISGIGPFIEEKLHEVKIFTFRQISRFTLKDIDTMDEVIEFFHGRITRDEWVAQANELVQAKDKRLETLRRIRSRRSKIVYDRIGTATKEEADDLTDISGIGGWINEKLNALGIHTFRQISNFTKEDEHTVTEAIEYFHGRIERDEWIPQAKELVRMKGKKVDLLNRIRDRKTHVAFDRLGKAQKHEAHNLTLISGVGLWIEERLNTLGIYTIGQISKLTSEDVESLTEILEIPEGRIEKDKWISQAKELQAIKDGKNVRI